MESLESCFEDFGEAALVNGNVQVKFDPQFASLVRTKRYHVFLSLYGDCNGLYVSVRSTTGSECASSNGAPNIGFSYRIVADRLAPAREVLAFNRLALTL
jgi:hypothetical protein